MRFLFDGNSYAFRWYSVDRCGGFLLIVRVVVGARGGVCNGVLYIVGGTMRVIGGWGLGPGSG